jgi:hypothetical protein
MAMLSNKAAKKGRHKMRWYPKGPYAVFLFGQEFCGELGGIAKAEKNKSDAQYIQYNKKGFYRRVDEALAQVETFPTGFTSKHFLTKCIHYIDDVQ